MGETASADRPQYKKLHQSERPDRAGTSLYMIIVDEGWRTWILCTDMYDWAADDLLEILRASNHNWPK